MGGWKRGDLYKGKTEGLEESRPKKEEKEERGVTREESRARQRVPTWSAGMMFNSLYIVYPPFLLGWIVQRKRGDRDREIGYKLKL
jgi:hypothetical protein